MNREQFQARKAAAAIDNFTIGKTPRSILEQFAAKREEKTPKEKPRVLNTSKVQAAIACGRPIPKRTLVAAFEPRR
jgi:hypothetical protein